jgi:hypothetical protein
LWRRPRPKLGCGAKERRKKNVKPISEAYSFIQIEIIVFSIFESSIYIHINNNKNNNWSEIGKRLVQ